MTWKNCLSTGLCLLFWSPSAFSQECKTKPSSIEDAKNALQKNLLLEHLLNPEDRNSCAMDLLNPAKKPPPSENSPSSPPSASSAEIRLDLSDLFPTDQQKILNRIRTNPDFQRNMACGRSIETIEISASVSRYQPDPAWNYKKIPMEHANYIKTTVLPELHVTKETVIRTTLGEYDSGASGPCPFRFKVQDDGKVEVVKNSQFFQPGVKEDLQKKYEYTRISIRFSESPHCE